MERAISPDVPVSPENQDCGTMQVECNRALASGGGFCLPNKWGRTTCY
jgi:hypothetical protein